MELFKPYFLAFIPIFVAVDVLGLLPMYMFLTEGLKRHEKNRVVWLSVLTALIVSIGFVFIGKAIFLALGIRVSDFLVAGGILLFIMAINDILSAEKRKPKLSSKMVGVVPLGMPLMVGPAVLTTTLIVLDTHGIFPTLTGLVLNIILVGIIFKGSNFFISRIGITGIRAASKLTSIMLSAYGVMMIRRGIAETITFYLK